MLAIVAITFNACFKFDDPPKQEPVTFPPEKIISIDSLKSFHRGQPVHFTDSIMISGRVISSDRSGNLYREFFIQDETGGLKIKVARSGLYNFYRLGQTIYINCRGLTLGNYAGTLELGWRSVDPRYETGFIEGQWLINQHIFQGPQGDPLEPRTVTLQQLNRSMIGTLVRIENLTFSHTDRSPTGVNIPTWAFPFPPDGAAPVTLSQVFTNGSNSIIVRTSGYARFAGTDMPTEPVNMVGILTIFNTTYQLVLRDLNDVEVRD